MATNSKIRVGIVGLNPSRGFASIAHIPALQALPDFEISAVCTTRQDSAEAAANHFGVPLAFSDAEKLAQHPDVDLVTVRACESFALFCSMKGLQQVLVVLLRGLDDWSEGEPVGVGQ